ncbi:MAG: flavodoxin family protein [Clostridia bacterium]|nr:flavodoxin family protein [Clostridia bacterium]
MATIAIRYFSRTGHSKQLAEAIGEALNLPALDIESGLEKPVDMLFLCNGMYAARIDGKLKDFLVANGEKCGEIINVCTSASGRSTRSQLEKLAEKHSFRLSGKEFCCKGAFHFLAKGRPDADDLKAAAAFAVAVTM